MVRGLMSDKEWAYFEPFVIETGPKRGRPPGDHRLVLDGVFWIARTGAPWRDLPEEFGKWGSVYRQFRRWSVAGVWDAMLEALNATGMAPRPIRRWATSRSRASAARRFGDSPTRHARDRDPQTRMAEPLMGIGGSVAWSGRGRRP